VVTDEVTREWRKLHNEEVNDLHSSLIIFWGDQLEKNEVGGMQHVWGRVEVYTGRWWRDRGEKPLWRPRRRWEDNIKMDLQEVGCDGMDWIDLAQDRDGWRALVNAVMNLPVP